MINAPRNLNFACERETAFASLATATGASLEVLEADDAIEDEGERRMHEALARGLWATAASATDRLAMGALLAARAAGRQVGKELSIVGYDDLPFSRYADPPLTTIRQPIREAGRRLAEHLVVSNYRAGPSSRRRSWWQPELVLRASHAPAGHARPGKAA